MQEQEIERRWILRKMPDQSLISHSWRRFVGYVAVKNNELRVSNRTTIGTNEHKYMLSIKTDGNLIRKEWQTEIPKWAYDAMYPNFGLKTLNINRYFIQFGEYTLEIDEYFGNLRGLIKLECEFKSESEAHEFKVPSFLGEVIEVTQDSRFNNKNLSILNEEGIKLLFKEFDIRIED